MSATMGAAKRVAGALLDSRQLLSSVGLHKRLRTKYPWEMVAFAFPRVRTWDENGTDALP